VCAIKVSNEEKAYGVADTSFDRPPNPPAFIEAA
jgi:hypothetical protein